MKTRRRVLDDDWIEWGIPIFEGSGSPPHWLLVTAAPGELIEVGVHEMTSTSDKAERLNNKAGGLLINDDHARWLLEILPLAIAERERAYDPTDGDADLPDDL